MVNNNEDKNKSTIKLEGKEVEISQNKSETEQLNEPEQKKKVRKPISVQEKIKRTRKHIPGPSKIKKRMSAQEKLSVLDKFIEGKNYSQIATDLSRTVPTITKTLAELKDKLKSAFGQELSTGIGNEFISTVNYLESEAFGRVVNKLVSEGLTEDIARSRVIKIFVLAQQKNIEEINESELYLLAKSTLSGKEIFSTKSDNGNSSIVAINSSASEHGDALQSIKKTSNIQDHVDGQRLFKVN